MENVFAHGLQEFFSIIDWGFFFTFIIFTWYLQAFFKSKNHVKVFQMNIKNRYFVLITGVVWCFLWILIAKQHDLQAIVSTFLLALFINKVVNVNVFLDKVFKIKQWDKKE